MKRALITALASMMLLTGCTVGKDTIVKVNDECITRPQFNKEFKKVSSAGMLAQMNIEIPQDDNNFMYLMVKDKVINEMIVKSLIDQEIKKRHIKVTKKDIDQELQTMIDKIGSKEQFNEILKKNGISNEQFMNDLKDEVKVKKLVNTVEKVNVSDHEAEVFYKKNLKKFTYPDKVRAEHILIMANPQQIEKTLRTKSKDKTDAEITAEVNTIMNQKKAQADKIYNEIKNLPDNFEKTARQYSEDPVSAKKGGDLGFFAKSDMVEEFSKQAFSQQPNTVGPVIQTQYGFHIIKVRDRMVAGTEPFVKVKEQIKLYLQTQKQMEILEKIINQVKATANIQYVDESFNPQTIEKRAKELSQGGNSVKGTK